MNRMHRGNYLTMKMSFRDVIVFLIISALAFFIGFNNASANEVVQEVLSCTTKTGKHLSVTRDVKTDTFFITYGGESPSISVIKKGNNMGTSVRYSAAEQSRNREIYFDIGQNKFGIIGETINEGKRSAYFMVNHEESPLINDECDTAHMGKDLFDNSEIFRNFTEVDEE